MLDEPRHPLGESSPAHRHSRRKRVQSRRLPGRGLWDPTSDDGVVLVPGRRKRRRSHSTTRWLFQVFGCLALGLAIPVVVIWLQSQPWIRLKDSPLRQVSIDNEGSTFSDRVIMEKSGIRMGQDLRTFPAREVEAKLEAIPGIKAARVEIHFPGTLAIQLTERIPVAWLSCPEHGIEPHRDQGFFIDEERVVFPCEHMEDRFAQLPTLEIRGLAQPVAGMKVDSEMVREALKLVAASEILFGGMRVIEVRPISEWGLLCQYPDNLMVTFSIDRLEAGLRDLFVILNEARVRNLTLATVDLVPEKNIPITFHGDFDPTFWQNIAETGGNVAVMKIDEKREKHLRSVFDDSLFGR